MRRFQYFHEALNEHMLLNKDSTKSLFLSIKKPNENFNETTLGSWRRGEKSPRSLQSYKILNRIEVRYNLPIGYFKKNLSNPTLASTGFDNLGIKPSRQRRVAWHLPDDYKDRSVADKKKILEWIEKTIISGATDFRKYQSESSKHPYGLRFNIPSVNSWNTKCHRLDNIASESLNKDFAALIEFKTSVLTMRGYERNGTWGIETALQKIEHFGLFFGALSASRKKPLNGYGIPREKLSLAMLIFPSVWDWYFEWRKSKRGFFTSWEVDMAQSAYAFARAKTGWVRQNPHLSNALRPVDGLITATDVKNARDNWNAACDQFCNYIELRKKEISLLKRVHRDPFEPILTVLKSDSPLHEYRKISTEILKYMPVENNYPRRTAEIVRSYLLIRLGLHTGLRQKNLRELLFTPKGQTPRSEKSLEKIKKGELRWLETEAVWEVFIPSIAFKNSNSSYFKQRPYRLKLPDLENLYNYVEVCISAHRKQLLRQAEDPHTFFIKTVKQNSQSAAYNQQSFYQAWREIIQKYGIYNPYTKRGAIEGLLPHGPHSVRDVLATHILKMTGSYEQASYAIQDTPEVVAQHYGRFLPEDKIAMAAKILNKAWEGT